MDTLIIPRRITRDYILLHPEYVFIYSASVHHEKGFGQASVAKGCPNAFPVPVRWSYCRSNGWFDDNNYLNISIEIEVAISNIPIDKPIIPFPKIGEGASRLRYNAPKCYAFLMSEIDKIKYPEIRYE